MPRYDDRYSNTHLYVGRLFTRTRFRDLEGLFNRYGRVRDMDMKHDYAFVVAYRWDYGIWISLVLFLPLYFYSQEFSDPRDTDDARYGLNGREFDGSRIIVEFAKGVSVVNYMLCLFLLNSSTRSILDWRKVVFDSCGFLWRPHSHKK
ncbi:hypothetical protein CsSME_00017157 [Camellia sinensis var. sinensis]